MLEVSPSSNDSAYANTESQLQACKQQRTALVSVIQTALQKAESGQEPVSDHRARDLVGQADRLIADAKTLAGASTPPSSTVCN